MSILEDQVQAIFDLIEPYIYPDASHRGRPDDEAEIKAGILSILTPPSLDDYGLIVGQEIKFVPPGGSNRKDGHVSGINPDGSIFIKDHTKDFGRSILPENLYVNIPGPRGGSSWKRLRGNKDA